MSGRAAPLPDDQKYLSGQLITCLGNKRALLGFIGEGLSRVMQRLGGRRPSILDAFSGSGAVSRLFKLHASRLVVNDLEPYAEVLSRCYLANRSETDLARLWELYKQFVQTLGNGPLSPGLISRLYAPADDSRIAPGERVFYTTRNACYLDSARSLVDGMGGIKEADRPFFIAPLVVEASIHANTSGVFKGFHKDASTGLGSFGGRKADALGRIRGDIELPFPLLCGRDCPVEVLRGDTNVIIDSIGEVDLAYLDPPYNQHPYGSNYFMLNLLAEYRQPRDLSRVSGIPGDWNRSDYNSRGRALSALAGLVARVPANFLLVSFNSEGFVSRLEMEELLGKHGRVEVFETGYSAFKGSRNFSGRPARVSEYLYLLERS
ncbi:MAG: DNA adenine methylase [Rectinemataceae bacterium]